MENKVNSAEVTSVEAKSQNLPVKTQETKKIIKKN